MTDYLEVKFVVQSACGVGGKQLCNEATDGEMVFVGATVLFKYKGYVVVKAEYVYDDRDDGETTCVLYRAIQKDEWEKHFEKGEDNKYYYYD